jgi:hypothetical protein
MFPEGYIKSASGCKAGFVVKFLYRDVFKAAIVQELAGIIDPQPVDVVVEIEMEVVVDKFREIVGVGFKLCDQRTDINIGMSKHFFFVHQPD